jgi:hypothetical protein
LKVIGLVIQKATLRGIQVLITFQPSGSHKILGRSE